MHIIIAQTARIVWHAQVVVKNRIFRIFKILVYHQRAHSGTYPDMSTSVTCNETHFEAIIYGITLQMIAVTDKDFLSAFIFRQIIDAGGKCCHPNASFRILIDTIHIITAQTINIIFIITITSQFITERSLHGFGFHHAVTFCGNPQVFLAVLHHKISVTRHGFTRTGYNSRLS